MRVRIAIIRLLQFFSTGLIIPVLTLLLLERGLTLSRVSIVFACFSAATILLEVPTGVIADLGGRKKTFLVSCLFTAAAFGVILIGKSFFVLCVGSALYGVSRALSSGSLDALFIEQYTKEHGQEKLPKIISLFSVTEAVGLALGSLSGGCLPILAGRYFPSIGTYDLNLIVLLFCVLTLFVLVALLVREEKRTEKHDVDLKRHLKNSVACIKSSANLKWIFLSLAGTGVFLSAVELCYQPRFQTILKNDDLLWLLGVLATLYFGAVLAGSLIGETCTSRFSLRYKTLYLSSKLLSGAALFALALQNQAVPFVAFYMLVYLFSGASKIPEGTLINLEIADDKRASVLSLQSLVQQVGMLLGSLAGGLVVKLTGIPLWWMISAGVMALSAIAAVKIRERG